MKKFFQCLSAKQIICGIIVAVSLILWGGLTLYSVILKTSLPDQNTASRWSDKQDAAQISCFFTEKTEVDKNKIMSFRMQLEAALKEASITKDKESSRLYVDAYSAQGTISLQNGKTVLEAKAVGIGGDFFYFHPLTLVNGTYFTGNDLMHDKVIIDEDAAWQLFGSSDVAGMEVHIGGIPHIISGVVKREEGRLAERAGLDKTVVYVSGESLLAYGKSAGINQYEIVMPNPVKGFAYGIIKEKFGIDENQMWVIDNTVRYDFKALFTVISEFGTRSMNAYAINYPYWENIARGYEDILAIILVLQILCLLIPSMIIIVVIVVLWKRKTWTFLSVWHSLADAKDRFVYKCRNEKDKWKHF